MAGSMLKQNKEAEQLKTDMATLGEKVGEHDNQITNIQSIMTLGFIIALITLAGVVIAALAFVSTEVHNSSQQTILLQEIKDKVSK